MTKNININQQNFFKGNGYLIMRYFLNSKELSKIRKILKKLEKGQKKLIAVDDPGVDKSQVNFLNDEKGLDFIKNKSSYKKLTQKLLKSQNIYTWGAKCNLKKKWHGSCEYYHQDFFYNRQNGFKTPNMLACAIFIDDHSHENGGIWLFPKSHKKTYKHKKFLNINSLQKYLVPTNILNKISKISPPISINEKKGSCIFFHSKIIHGSSHNVSGRDRKTLIYDICAKKDFEKILKLRAIDEKKNRKMYEKKELQKRLKKLYAI